MKYISVILLLICIVYSPCSSFLSNKNTLLSLSKFINNKSNKLIDNFTIKTNCNNHKNNNLVNKNQLDENVNSIVKPNYSIIVASFLLFILPSISVASQVISPIDNSFNYWDYHLRYFLSGGLCCAISHGVSVPFDVIKTLKQSDSRLSTLSFKEIIRLLIKENGINIFLKGIGPTIIGYFIQGSLKYGFYEIFKPITNEFIHKDPEDVVTLIISYMIAGLLAELIGSTVLSPFEATRIQLVTSTKSISFISCLNNMIESGGFLSLFDSLPAIFSKQIPYTMVQLSSYELISRNIYTYLSQHGYDTSDYKFVISLISASIAAVLSSLVSQPGDTLLTIINKSKKSTANVSIRGIDNTLRLMKSSIQDIGIKGLFIGTKARLYHVGVIVVIQLTVYDVIKQLCGLPVTGAH